MVSVKFILCAATLFCAAMAAPGRGPIVSIDEEFLPISLRSGTETSEYFMDESSSGFGRISRTGISVTKGASGILDFEVTVKAIDADRLSKKDAKFVETLTTEERVEYDALKKKFTGRLNVPWLWYLGANLQKKVTREDLEVASSTLTDYTAKSSAAEEILESVVDTRIHIFGTLEATGISFRPTVAYAFVRLARVKFADGSSQYVVSNHADDLTAATRDGEEMPSEGKKLNILLG